MLYFFVNQEVINIELIKLYKGESIARRDISEHIDTVCPMQEKICLDCFESTTRGNFNNHLNQCQEYEIKCTYYEFGCTQKIKRRLLNEHLKHEELNHLRLKVKIVN